MFLRKFKKECICLHKDAYPDVHHSFICNCQNRNHSNVHQPVNEQFMSINTMEYQEAVKKDEFLILVTTHMKLQKYSARGQKPDTRSHMLHDSIHIKFLKRQNYRERQQIRVYLGPGQGEGLTARGLKELIVVMDTF